MDVDSAIRDCLARHPEVAAAYLFGSHAEDRAHRESDVDVGGSDAEVEHAFRRDVQLRAADLAPFLERTRRRVLERLGR